MLVILSVARRFAIERLGRLEILRLRHPIRKRIGLLRSE